MNKKGFSLVELLATIVIIALLSGVATISYSAFIRQSENNTFERYQDTMHSEAVAYFLDNPTEIPTSSTKRLSLAMLKTKAINNPVDKDDLCPNSYVDVTRNSSSGMISLKYNVCLKCRAFDKCKEYID